MTSARGSIPQLLHVFQAQSHRNIFPSVVLFLRKERIGLALLDGAFCAFRHRVANRTLWTADGDDHRHGPDRAVTPQLDVDVGLELIGVLPIIGEIEAAPDGADGLPSPY